MVNVIIHGCGGKMGHVVAELVKNEPDCQVVAGIDPPPLRWISLYSPAAKPAMLQGMSSLTSPQQRQFLPFWHFPRQKKSPLCSAPQHYPRKPPR